MLALSWPLGGCPGFGMERVRDLCLLLSSEGKATTALPSLSLGGRRWDTVTKGMSWWGQHERTLLRSQ